MDRLGEERLKTADPLSHGAGAIFTSVSSLNEWSYRAKLVERLVSVHGFTQLRGFSALRRENSFSDSLPSANCAELRLRSFPSPCRCLAARTESFLSGRGIDEGVVARWNLEEIIRADARLKTRVDHARFFAFSAAIA